MITTLVDNLLTKITPDELTIYSKYWNNLRPQTLNEVFQRWMFSYLSVHTTWQANVRSFLMLKDLTWVDDKSLLEKLIVDSRVGLTRVRTEGIWKFYADFWGNPNSWLKQGEEDWTTCRDRFAARCFGLGLTKTSFSCEMIYPLECEVVCLDAHILKLFEYPKSKGAPHYKQYRLMEEHWSNKCKELNIPSPIARNIVWDKLLNQKTMDYWSHVFH